MNEAKVSHAFGLFGCCRKVHLSRSIASKLIYGFLQQQKCCTSNKSCQKATKSPINNKRPTSLMCGLMTQLMHLMANKTDNGSELISIIYCKLLYGWKGLALSNV
jgi:hypothetical protein